MKFKSYLAFQLYFYSVAVPYNQPTSIETAVIGESTPHVHFKELPSKEPIVVGIYKFRDQTGQYKAPKMGAHLVLP
jgi:curli production assembly/transport component CsgG